MTAEDYGAIRILAYYYHEGYSDSEVRRRAMNRLPGFTAARLDELATYAAASLQVAERFDPSRQNESLFDILGGFDPPANEVAVSFLFKYTKPDGSVRENTVKVLTNWFATMSDVYEEALANLSEITAKYGQVSTEFLGIVGGIMTPSDEQI